MMLQERLRPDYSPRLRLARQFQGWTQADFGDRIGVSRQFIHQLETGAKPVPRDLEPAICAELGFEPRFFALPVLRELRDEECHFRRRRTTPVHVRNRVLAHGTLFSEFASWLDRTLKLPAVSVPSYECSSAEAIERTAERCRKAWGLTVDAPIENVTRVMERSGVFIAHFTGISEKVDAFSWHGKRPLIIRSTDKGSPARSRFDIAHECGHLVLHSGVLTDDVESERQADRFASAFLLPRAGFAKEFPRGSRLDWIALIRLKERWGASLQAIVRRAFDLGLIPHELYRRAYVHMSKRGWRTQEPGQVPEEAPELIATSLCVARDRLGISGAAIARELGWAEETFERITDFGVSDETPADVISLRGRHIEA